MSCYEWERGQVLLPQAAVTPLKKVLRVHVNREHEQAVKLANEFYAYSKGTRSRKLFLERLSTWQVSKARRDRYGHPVHDPIVRGVRDLLEDSVGGRYIRDPERTPHKLTVAEISKRFPKATNKTNKFRVRCHEGCEAGIIELDGRTLSWECFENNHATERFHEAPIVVEMFKQLKRVQWTRDTGGRSWGSNEYADEARRDDGYAADLAQETWGPVGEQYRADQMGVSLQKYRKTQAEHKRQSARYGIYGRIPGAATYGYGGRW